MALAALVISSSLVLWLVAQFASLCRNYAKARRAGLPIIVAPFSQFSIPWLLFQTCCDPEKWFIPLFRFCLPESASRFTRVIRMNWVREDGPDLHRRLGPAFFIVGPSHIIFACADNLANGDFLANTKKWARFNDAVSLNTLFGRNIVVAEGEEWRRHKRIIGPCFNERTSECVWLETRRQALGMLDKILERPDCEQTSVFRDGRTISLHVFLAAALGLPQDFATCTDEKFPGQKLRIQDSLGGCVDSVMLTWVGRSLGPKWVRFFPKSVRQARKAWEQTDRILRQLLASEENSPTTQGQNFLKQLTRFVEKPSTEPREKTQVGSCIANPRMSRSEVMGNLFTLIRAGHETTASAISISIALLAAHPRYLTWIQEEIDGILADGADPNDYKTTFPKLKRVQAVMFETERLYYPLIVNLRYSRTDSMTQLSDGRCVFIPAQTRLQLNLHVSYCNDTIWGDDPHEWRPDRFIIPHDAEKTNWPEYKPQPEGDTLEKLVVPRQEISSFWGAGPRICVGIKFSQVEFVGALFTAFSRASVGPSSRMAIEERGLGFDEKRQQLCEELKKVIRNAGHSPQGPLLHIFEPEKVVLAWHRKENGIRSKRKG